jgi:hypothetical protein
MIDNMQGLYPSALDAYEAGKRNGQEEALKISLHALSLISSKYEGESMPQALQAFRAAEECCKAVRELRARLKQESV